MLLDEDPAALIHECTSNFNIYPDRAALSRISESLGALGTARSLRLREAESALKKLSRTLNTLSQQHSLALSAHNPAEHASNILALDTRKFKVAKEASDMEIEGERLEQEILGLDGILKDLDAQMDGTAPGTRNADEDESILKLKVYRSLGIDLQANDRGIYERAIVRNVLKGDVNIISIDPARPRQQYASKFWEAI